MATAKDFTRAQADRWVEQESAKHNDIESIRHRLASEIALLTYELPGFPISTMAHRDLVLVLTDKMEKLKTTT